MLKVSESQLRNAIASVLSLLISPHWDWKLETCIFVADLTIFYSSWKLEEIGVSGITVSYIWRDNFRSAAIF